MLGGLEAFVRSFARDRCTQSKEAAGFVRSLLARQGKARSEWEDPGLHSLSDPGSYASKLR